MANVGRHPLGKSKDLLLLCSNLHAKTKVKGSGSGKRSIRPELGEVMTNGILNKLAVQEVGKSCDLRCSNKVKLHLTHGKVQMHFVNHTTENVPGKHFSYNVYELRPISQSRETESRVRRSKEKNEKTSLHVWTERKVHVRMKRKEMLVQGLDQNGSERKGSMESSCKGVRKGRQPQIPGNTMAHGGGTRAGEGVQLRAELATCRVDAKVNGTKHRFVWTISNYNQSYHSEKVGARETRTNKPRKEAAKGKGRSQIESVQLDGAKR